MRTLLLLFTVTIALADDDAAAIMTKVAANVEKSTDARRQYVYRQSILSNLVRSNGKIARKENREYQVFPTETGSEKKLVSLEGQLRRGKQSTNYTEAGFKNKDLDIDGALIREVIDDLVDDKKSRDGIPPSLFPLCAKDLPGYRFTSNGEVAYQGRRAHPDAAGVSSAMGSESVPGHERPAEWIRDYVSEGGGERVVSGELWDGVPVQCAVGIQADGDAVACE